MATLGLTKLEAVNVGMESIGELPVTAVDPLGAAGTTTEAEAERILDRISEQLQAWGWPENTDLSESLTSVDVGGGVFNITLASDTLSIKPVGQNAHRTLVPRLDLVYDADQNTSDFKNEVTIEFDIVHELTFINLSPKLKHLIAHHAALIMQRRRTKSTEQDIFLLQERQLFDLHADRSIRHAGDDMTNFTPIPFGPTEPNDGRRA